MPDPDTILLEAGAELDRALRVLDWSQAKLATCKGVQRNTVGRFLRAETSPTLTTLARFAPPGWRWRLVLEREDKQAG